MEKSAPIITVTWKNGLWLLKTGNCWRFYMSVLYNLISQDIIWLTWQSFLSYQFIKNTRMIHTRIDEYTCFADFGLNVNHDRWFAKPGGLPSEVNCDLSRQLACHQEVAFSTGSIVYQDGSRVLNYLIKWKLTALFFR